MNVARGVAVIVVLLGVAAVVWLAFFPSEETKVRRVLTSMIDGYNSRRASKAIDGFDETFTFQRREHEKALAKAYLQSMFIPALIGNARPYTFTAEMDEGAMEVKVHGEKNDAFVDVRYRFLESGEPLPWEEASVFLEKIDGEWKIVEVRGSVNRRAFP